MDPFNESRAVRQSPDWTSLGEGTAAPADSFLFPTFLWPLVAMLWAFDVETVARRSPIATWIRECRSVPDCYAALYGGRGQLGAQLRDVENFPRHEEMRG
jgi:hypothetical protein